MKKILLKKLAKLSNLNLTDKQLEKYKKDLSGILDYVSEISDLNLKNIQPTSHIAGLENVMRQDKIKPLNFNHDSGKYFKTKKILN